MSDVERKDYIDISKHVISCGRPSIKVNIFEHNDDLEFGKFKLNPFDIICNHQSFDLYEYETKSIKIENAFQIIYITELKILDKNVCTYTVTCKYIMVEDGAVEKIIKEFRTPIDINLKDINDNGND